MSMSDHAPDRRPVLIECPATGQLVRAGIEATDLDELPEVGVTDCLACGSAHTWQRSEATFAIPTA